MPTSGTVTVLFVRGDPDDAVDVCRCLENAPGLTLDVFVADSVGQACRRLASGGVDLALLGLEPADCDRYDAIGRLRAAAGSAPIIVVTGQPAEGHDIVAVRRGAQDFLTRSDMSPSSFARAIRFAIERHRMLERLGEYARQARAAESQLRSVIFRNVDAIVVVDTEHVIRFANPAAEIFFGRTMRELERMEFECPVPDDRSIEIEVLRPDGVLKRGEMTDAAIDWEGTEARVISIRDTSRRRTSGAQLRRRDSSPSDADEQDGARARAEEGRIAEQVGETLRRAASAQPEVIQLAQVSVGRLQERLRAAIRSGERLVSPDCPEDVKERRRLVVRMVAECSRVHELLGTLLPVPATRTVVARLSADA